MKHIFIFFFICLFTFSLNAQDERPRFPKVDASVMDMEYFPSRVSFRNFLSGDERNLQPKTRVIYSRPTKKGRTIFGDLVPYGQRWRLGANEATRITFYQSVAIGDYVVSPGEYTMSADVNKENWTVHFSTQSGIWGAANMDESLVVASITVPVTESKADLEAFSMGYREIDENMIHLTMQWEKTLVEVPVGLNPAIFASVDKSPMDQVTYPSKAAYVNYLKGDEVNLKPKMTVLYSRPYKNGRDIFGDLHSSGLWRLGANQSTEVVFMQDVKVNGKDLKRGKYVLFADIKGSSWDLIFSKDYPSAGPYDRDEEKDALRVNVPAGKHNEVVENLTIVAEEKENNLVHLVIVWDQTIIELPIQF